MSAPSSDKMQVHFGVGGAGNTTHSLQQDYRQPGHMYDHSTRREINGRRFSTGIGGAGNISAANKLERQYDDEETARLLHDFHAPGIALVQSANHTGIGGAANTYQPSEAEMAEARLNNEHVRRRSMADVSRRRESLASSVASSDHRKLSFTESMKEVFMGWRRPSKV